MDIIDEIQGGVSRERVKEQISKIVNSASHEPMMIEQLITLTDEIHTMAYDEGYDDRQNNLSRGAVHGEDSNG